LLSGQRIEKIELELLAGIDLLHAAPPVVVATMKLPGPTAKHADVLGQLIAWS
jgi:hypothetical protein